MLPKEGGGGSFPTLPPSVFTLLPYELLAGTVGQTAELKETLFV